MLNQIEFSRPGDLDICGTIFNAFLENKAEYHPFPLKTTRPSTFTFLSYFMQPVSIGAAFEH